MKRKQRHSVEFCFIALCAVLFHKELSDSCGELAKVVGGKDRGAVISAGSLEGTPLERHCKEHGVKSHNRRHSGRKESQEQDRKDIDPDTDKTENEHNGFIPQKENAEPPLSVFLYAI